MARHNERNGRRKKKKTPYRNMNVKTNVEYIESLKVKENVVGGRNRRKYEL